MMKIGPLGDHAITLITRIFSRGPFGQIAEFLELAKIIIALILILYTRKVLKLSTKATMLVGAFVILVFFTDFWIFGSMRVIALTVIGFLVVGILGFLD